MLRDALGDSAGNPRYIETFPGEGYRFIPIPQDRRSFAVRSRNMRRIDSVAVLPFVSENADAEVEFLKKRVGERLIDNISRVPGLRVLAYRTVQHFRDKDLVPTRVGRDLLVRAVAVGEILQRNDEVLLHIELIDVGDGTQLWGAQFGGLLVDVIRCPEKLADSVSDQLLPILVPAVSRIKEELHERAA